MKKSILFLLMLITIFTSCDDLFDRDDVYNENIEITGLSASNDYYGYDENIKYDKEGNYESISASNYVIKLQFRSDNKYATKYGIAPTYNGSLKSLKIRSLSKISSQIDSSTILNNYFLVSRGEYSNELYTGIDIFLREGIDFSSIDLVFFYDSFAKSVEFFDKKSNDCAFEIEITFEDNKQYKDSVAITLIK